MGCGCGGSGGKVGGDQLVLTPEQAERDAAERERYNSDSRIRKEQSQRNALANASSQ